MNAFHKLNSNEAKLLRGKCLQCINFYLGKTTHMAATLIRRQVGRRFE